MTDTTADGLAQQLGKIRNQMAAAAADQPTPQQLADWDEFDRNMAARIQKARPGIPLHHAYATLQTLRAIHRGVEAPADAPAVVQPVDRAALRQRIAEILRPHASLGGVPPRYELPFFDGATPSLPRISGWKPLDDVAEEVLAVLPERADTAAVLLAAANVIDAHQWNEGCVGVGCCADTPDAAADLLRRMADEAQQDGARS